MRLESIKSSTWYVKIFFFSDFFAQKGLEGTACALNMEEVGLLLKKSVPLLKYSYCHHPHSISVAVQASH